VNDRSEAAAASGPRRPADEVAVSGRRGKTAPEAAERSEREAQPSGLRNPPAAVRGVGLAALSVQALALLLAIAPLARLGGSHRGIAILLVVLLAALSVLFAGLLRRSWVWYAAGGIPVVLIAATPLQWSLGVLGVLFGLLWLYVFYIRRAVLSGGPANGST
jgi:hypothetical protein